MGDVPIQYQLKSVANWDSHCNKQIVCIVEDAITIDFVDNLHNELMKGIPEKNGIISVVIIRESLWVINTTVLQVCGQKAISLKLNKILLHSDDLSCILMVLDD